MPNNEYRAHTVHSTEYTEFALQCQFSVLNMQ
jgi:hypothetical protein